MFSRLFERRASPEDPRTSLGDPDKWLWAALGAERSFGGVSVNEQTAMGLPAVYACINILASALGQLPCNLHRERDGKRDLEKNHAVYRLLRHRPNPEMTPFTFFQTMQGRAAGWGNAYALINFNRANYPMELWPLSSATTTPIRVGTELLYEFDRGNGSRVRAPAEHILHIKALSGDGLIGWSPIRAQRELIGAALAQQEFSSKFYQNGATPSGVLTFPGKINDTEKLRNEWQKSQTGENRAKVAVLENGMKYEKISIDPVDAEFVETRKLTAVEIASIFRVPPHMINVLDRATWGNVESLGLEFVVHTLGAWFINWQQELEWKLLSERERSQLYIRFDPRSLMKGDHKARAGYYKSGVLDGWMTRNEVRALEDMNPLDGLDKPLQPMNFIGANDPHPKTAAPADPNADPKADPNKDQQSDGEKKAGRAAFEATVTRLVLREQRKIEALAKRCARASPDVFHREAANLIESECEKVQQMFGCDDLAVVAYRDQRVFALSGLDTVQSVHAWLADQDARRAEIEDIFDDRATDS